MALMSVTIAEAIQLKGKPLGVTDWQEVTQERINQFAEATLDRQWIHIDPVRAARESPFRKRTIAHGYFTLGLVPHCFWDLIEIRDVRMIINYGSNKVRFPGPVPIPSRVRMRGHVLDVTEQDSAVTFTVEATIEVENQTRPGLVAEVLYRYYI